MTLHSMAGSALAAAAALFASSLAVAEPQAYARGPEGERTEWGGCPGFMPEGCRIAILHGDPSKRHADIFFRVPGGAEVPRHWHSSPERMVLVSGEMRVDYDGQAPVTLTPGRYAYGPAEKPHSATCLSEGACTLFIAFVDPIDAMKGAPD